MAEKGFIEILKNQGYSVNEKKLGGGFVNDVRLITAQKGGEVFQYVLKKYGNKKDVSDMLRGYDAITASSQNSGVQTPTIVYKAGNEVAYNFLKGKSIKDMILKNDPDVYDAISKLAKELEHLHSAKNFNSNYRKDNSPDEKKMLAHVAKALGKGHLDRASANAIVREINNYIPKNKSLIHGDAHLGNFIYSEGKVHIIDPDNVKISDYNADIGKVVHAIEELNEKGNISHSQAAKLQELFLSVYEGEDNSAVNIYRLRTPLIDLKNREKDHTKVKVNKIVRNLESRIAISVLLIFLVGLLLSDSVITGMVVSGNTSSDFFPFWPILILAIGASYFFVKKTEEQ